MKRFSLGIFMAVLVCLAGGQTLLHAQAKSSAAATTILNPAAAAKLTPATVFFRGQIAPMQQRNTFGLRTADGSIVLMGLVDNSGYSTGIQQKYQGYILTEVPLDFSGKKLTPGAYGFGFLASNSFSIMNLDAKEVLSATWSADAKLVRPRPLQIVPGAQANMFRLYSGRKFVNIHLEP
ncbi:MAG TPA: hypothetical protein VMU62_06190 [Acidobacteriaceae bacterium]|nr:hypothetical protein [Acidobacteriaceae bacterium]